EGSIRTVSTRISSIALVRADPMANATTTERSIGSPVAAPNGSLVSAVWPPVAAVVLVVIAYNARMGAVSPRIANPEVTGIPRPVEFLLGWTGWVAPAPARAGVRVV